MSTSLPIHRQATPGRLRLLVLASLVIVLMVTLGVEFFARSRAIMEEQLRMNLRNTAAAAAMQFDGSLIDQIHDAKDVSKPAFKTLVMHLHQLRVSIPAIRFAYILRRSYRPSTLSFVADADALSSDADLDTNHNGVVDPNELPSFPGDAYDISEVPALQHDAFSFPTTDQEITYDQWGGAISGYAPIRRASDGTVVAVLGIDMLANQYLQAAYSIFSPGALFMVLLAIVCLTSGFVLLLIDRQVHALRQINQERSGLLQLTFHQLGEPLTIFKWSLEGIKERAPGESLEELIPEHIKNMEIGIERISQIIDALRGAEQIELKTISYEPRITKLTELFHTIATVSQPFLAHKRQTLDIVCEEGIVSHCDPKWIEQVLSELLKNAMAYSPESTDITLRAQKYHGQVMIQVIDRGVGIDETDLPHLFEKFSRGSDASLHSAGTGLGLYTTKGIVQIAGGKIWVESERGKGTTVSFTLPIAKP